MLLLYISTIHQSVIVASFKVQKETLTKGKGNVYNNLLGNILNNHILSAE